MAAILLLHGPNLNLLGSREPATYGRLTLPELEAGAVAHAAQLGHQLSCFQTNAEHALLERIHAARLDGTAFIVIQFEALLTTLPLCTTIPKKR